MTDDRWQLLMDNDLLNLTAAERAEGWHFCLEFDGLLVGPGMGELRSCRCPAPAIEKARAAMPPEPPPTPQELTGPPPF